MVTFFSSEEAGRLVPERTALLMIDMEKGFVEPGAALQIAGAKATVPVCSKMVAEARAYGIQVIWVKRIYAPDYSDMEIPRRRDLEERGLMGILAPDSTGLNSIEEPDGLAPAPGDMVLIKPRYSAFFKTDLNGILQEDNIDTILVAGTTTPNCIRTTCYDGIALNYQVIVLEQACSSNTPEIQEANMRDMENVGAKIFRAGSLTPMLLGNFDAGPDYGKEQAAGEKDAGVGTGAVKSAGNSENPAGSAAAGDAETAACGGDGEWWDVYDQNRVKTGRVCRRTDSMKPGEYHLVTHVVIFNSRGEMLIQHRQAGKKLFPDCWDITMAGNAKAGEDSRQAAARELFEELGIREDFSDSMPAMTVNFNEGFDDIYILRRDINLDDLKLQEEEVDEVMWADRETAVSLLSEGKFMPYCAGFLEFLFEEKDGAGFLAD